MAQQQQQQQHQRVSQESTTTAARQYIHTCLLHLALFFILYLLITTCVVVLYTWLKVSNHQTCANTCGIISIPWKMCLYPPPPLPPPPPLLILRAQLKRFFRCIAHTLTTLKLIRHSPSLDSLTSPSFPSPHLNFPFFLYFYYYSTAGIDVCSKKEKSQRTAANRMI